MKTIATSRSLRRNLAAAAATLLLTGPASLLAQDQTISGDLNVTGSLDISGPVFNLGTWTNDPAKLGLNITYAEDASHRAALSFIATRPVSEWRWLRARAATDATSVPQMTLSSGNALILFDGTLPTPNAAIFLDPVHGSYFGTDVELVGAYNKMYNQQLDDEGSILNVGLADDRYVLRGGGGSNSLALGLNASASGPYSTALGVNSSASQANATALSYGSVASGEYTVALGSGSVASGLKATSLGVNSAATGQEAVALGYASLASGSYAVTLGNGSRATAYLSTAIGSYSQALGNSSTALGHYSRADALAASALGVSSYAHGDYSTSLGVNSQASAYSASALGAYSVASGAVSTALGHQSVAAGDFSVALGWNSKANGVMSSSAGLTQADSYQQFTLGRYNLTGGTAATWVPSDELFTVGNGSDEQHRSNALSVKKNGDMAVSGTLTVAKALLIQPQGDLAMGEFTARPSPAP